LSHVMLNVMANAAQRVCLASLEMTPTASMAKMTRQAAAQAVPAIGYIRAFHRWTDGRLWIYDHVGRVAPTRMLALATYVRREMGLDHLVIDSLLKCGIATDDYTAQRDFVDGLTAIARDCGLHIHLVCHMRKGESERRPPDKFDVKGAGEIADLADNIAIIWKDQRKAEEVAEAEREPDEEVRAKLLGQLAAKPDTIVRITKQRHFEWEGSMAFWFDRGSQQFLESSKARPRWIEPTPIEREDDSRLVCAGADEPMATDKPEAEERAPGAFDFPPLDEENLSC
jgi:twinkle protein